MHRKNILILLVTLLLASCQSKVIDISHKSASVEISKLPTGKFTGIAWVNESTLLLEIDEGTSFENQRMCSRQSISILEIKTNQLRPLPSPFGNDCTSYIIRDLQVLPNQQVGYIFEHPLPKFSSIIVKVIDEKTRVESDLYTKPPDNFSLTRFSFSPNMKDLLLVDTRSALMKSAIYLLSPDETRTNLTTDFLRADFPVWSKVNNLIAFFGTKPYPGSNENIENFSQLESRVDYPWRLFLYDPEYITTEELPFDIVHPSSLKWSPDGKMLAFSGEYQGRHGVWIINNFANNDITITRVINGLATFDFSPDSKSIAYAYIGLLNTEKQNTLYMMNLEIGQTQ